MRRTWLLVLSLMLSALAGCSQGSIVAAPDNGSHADTDVTDGDAGADADADADADSGASIPALVQEATPYAGTGPSGTCGSITTTAGNQLIVIGKTSTTMTVSDSQGDTFQEATATATASGNAIHAFLALNIRGGATQITVNGADGTHWLTAHCSEWSNVVAIDTGNGTTYGSSTTIQTGLVSLANASTTSPELIIGATEIENTSAAVGASTDYGTGASETVNHLTTTQTSALGGMMMKTDYEIVTDIGSRGFQSTVSPASNGVGGIVAFKSASSDDCSDGTPDGSCSSTRPLYCSGGTLTTNCSECGCASGTCQTDGTCSSGPTCLDGTPYASCSGTQPLYCSGGTLVSQCATCGCSTGTCQADGTCEGSSALQWSTAYTFWIHGSYSPSEVPWASVTHLAFMGLTPDGAGSFDMSLSVSAENARAMADAAHEHCRKALICVGGWGLGRVFSSSTTDAVRPTFVRNIVDFMTSNGFDGVDLDWEDGMDFTQYLKLTQDLRAALDEITPRPVLTMAVACWIGGSEYLEFEPYLDQMNIMSYYSKPPSSSFASEMDCFTRAGIPNSKVGVGMGLGDDGGVDTTAADMQAKVDYGISNGYGGVMQWLVEDDLRADPPGSLMPVIAPYVSAPCR